MAPRPHDSAPPAGGLLADHVRGEATAFLRALRLRGDNGTAPGEAADAALLLRRSARRIDACLYTFRPLFEVEWADNLRTELAWLAGTLGREYAYAQRLDRLLSALQRLSGEAEANAAEVAAGVAGGAGSSGGADTAASAGLPALPAARTALFPGPAAPTAPVGAVLSVGAARAGALLERQLTLARNRAHSAALGALGSGRFHGVADSVAVLASEVPLRGGPADQDPAALTPLTARLAERVTEAVEALPLRRAGLPYNAAALALGAGTGTGPEEQDAPWLRARHLLRLLRYAGEAATGVQDPALRTAARALDRHRDAAEAAAAAASAARTPRIAPATAYSLGVLHADQRHDVEAARYAFQRAWHREAVTSA